MTHKALETILMGNDFGEEYINRIIATVTEDVETAQWGESLFEDGIPCYTDRITHWKTKIYDAYRFDITAYEKMFEFAQVMVGEDKTSSGTIERYVTKMAAIGLDLKYSLPKGETKTLRIHEPEFCMGDSIHGAIVSIDEDDYDPEYHGTCHKCEDHLDKDELYYDQFSGDYTCPVCYHEKIPAEIKAEREETPEDAYARAMGIIE